MTAAGSPAGRPAEPVESSPWNVPNALTALRCVLVPVFAWMLLAHSDEPSWRIGAMRFVVLRYGVMAANRGGKIKTVLQAVALILYLLPLPGTGPVHWLAVAVMAAAFLVTVVTGLDYVREAVKLRRQATTTAR